MMYTEAANQTFRTLARALGTRPFEKDSGGFFFVLSNNQYRVLIMDDGHFKMANVTTGERNIISSEDNPYAEENFHHFVR